MPIEGVPAAVRAMTAADATELTPLMHLFGTHELHDYRWGLQSIGHPVGQ